MSKTRVFKSGNSQAIRIPAELAYDDLGLELNITRMGNVITIYPAARNLAEAIALLRTLPKGLRDDEPFERIETRETNWD